MYNIVCFGDSNTWGANPYGGRHPYETRWTGILKSLLGENYIVQEEGINGRTTVFDDQLGDQWRNGYKGLGYVLSTHDPIDVLTLMLGTNDTRECLNASPVAIAKGMEKLVKFTQHFEYHTGSHVPKILVISPIHMGKRVLDIPRFRTYGPDAPEKTTKLAPLYQQVAKDYGCAFFDASTVAEPSDVDQLHMLAPSHRALAHALAPIIRELAEKG